MCTTSCIVGRSIGWLPLAAEERQLEHPLDLTEIFACVGDVWVDHLHHRVICSFGQDQVMEVALIINWLFPSQQLEQDNAVAVHI